MGGAERGVVRGRVVAIKGGGVVAKGVVAKGVVARGCRYVDRCRCWRAE